MNKELLEKFTKLQTRLEKLDKIVEDTDCEVSLVWFSDGGATLELSLYGVCVASTCRHPLGKFTVAEQITVGNGLSLEYVQEIASTLNKLVEKEET